MSNKALTWAFMLPIKGAPKAVLLALADHADDAGACFPSVPRLALFAGTSDRGARKAIRELEKIGLVRTVHATRKPSRYELIAGATIPEPRSASKPTRPRNHVPPSRNHVPPCPRNHVPLDPEPRSAEPSLNPHSEPSLNPQREPRARAAPGKAVTVRKASRWQDDQAFVAFWHAYPRKEAPDGNKGAWKAWQAALTKADAQTIIAGVVAYRFDADPRFQPMPARWLDEGRWIIAEHTLPATVHHAPSRNGAYDLWRQSALPGETVEQQRERERAEADDRASGRLIDADASGDTGSFALPVPRTEDTDREYRPRRDSGSGPRSLGNVLAGSKGKAL